MANVPEVAAPPVGDAAREARRVVVASAVGTMVEFYDFTLYGLASVLVFAPQFFPGQNSVAANLSALGTLVVGYLMRPLGGIVAGHFGDRIGRKRVLIATFLTMGLVTFLIALLPPYRTIGLAAPILLLVLRMLQGFAAGAEWGGAALMAVEHAPPKKRGLYGSAPAFGVNGGTILAIVVLLIVSSFARDAFVSYGWRIAFGFSVILVVFGFVVRLRLTESPLFERAVREEPVRVPLLRVLADHPAALLRGIRWVMVSAAFGLTMSPYSVGYAVAKTGLRQEAVLACLALGFVVNVVVVYVTARLLDGRRSAVLITVALIQIPSAIAFFPLLSLGHFATTALAYCVGLGTIGAMNGTLGSVLSDQFPIGVAYTGVSLCYNLAYALGGLAPLVAGAIVAATGSIAWMVVILAVTTVAALPVAFVQPRREALAAP
jgi:MFS family permease